MYTSVQYPDLVTALSVRLSDPAFQFWSADEMKSYLDESLRTWQAYSATYNIRVVFPTAANSLFYDLFSLVSELTPSVLDSEIVRDVALALQEPYDFSTGTWIGTSQFSIDDVYQSLNQRRNKFLLETGMVLTNIEINGPTPSTNTLILPQDVIDTRHILWKDDNNIYSLMWRLDPHTAASKSSFTQTPGTPIDYATFPLQPQVASLFPPPNTAGKANLLVVTSLPDADPDTPAILGIPDDFCWVIKYGILADMFGTDGPGQDDSRAAYCESRWKDGVTLARISNFVRLGHNAGVPTYIDSLVELNSGDPSWPSKTTGVPDLLATAGNMVSTSPRANGTYSLGIDIMAKMPIDRTGDVQIGPEIISVILDLAQHLADLKEGSEEIQASTRQFQNVIKLAAVQNDRLRAQAQNFDVLSNRDKRFSKEHLRRVSQLALKELDYAKE